ncbi:MAG: hypothetical protein KAI57_02560 [Candidatus Pacebacteria bacterium]|nr:hypothetical protein [Candidatus Paceibacterota bacterium]
MYNKKEIIRTFIFTLVFFTLLLSLFDFGYSKHRDIYSEYNGKIYSDFQDYRRQNDATEEDYEKACLSFMPHSFYKINHMIDYGIGFLALLLVLSFFVLIIIQKKNKQKIFSKKEKQFIFGIIFLSFVIYYYTGIALDSSYSYFVFGCSKFLL